MGHELKNRIKKLFCYLFLAFISTSINFNTEARLPKYMAQRAAELLIEKSNLQLKITTLINNDYVKLKESVIFPSIALALSKYTADDNVQCFITSIIQNMNQAKCEHKTEIKRVTEAISNEDIQSRLVVAIQALDKANKQFTEQVAIALKEAIIANEQAIYAHKLVEFLYTTEKRQHLANWMKRRLPFKVHGTPVAWKEDENDFKNLLDDINEAFNDTEVFRTFVNQHFPCWTGTMTCFMLKKGFKAYDILIGEKTLEVAILAALSSEDQSKKIIGVLFALEFIDTWSDIKQICKREEESDTSSRLDNPPFKDVDPYGCVPVPNTAYFMPDNRWPQGSCMVSTIRNLLYILCRNPPNEFNINTSNMRNEIKDEFECSIYTVPGTTSRETLKKFAYLILPGITEGYEPTLELFICTLNSMLPVTSRLTIPIPSPGQYLSGKLCKNNEKLLETILKKITGHDDIAVVAVAVNSRCSKLTQTWPKEVLIITDNIVNKKITIALGQCGAGHHVEIIGIN